MSIREASRSGPPRMQSPLSSRRHKVHRPKPAIATSLDDEQPAEKCLPTGDGPTRCETVRWANVMLYLRTLHNAAAGSRPERCQSKTSFRSLHAPRCGLVRVGVDAQDFFRRDQRTSHATGPLNMNALSINRSSISRLATLLACANNDLLQLAVLAAARITAIWLVAAQPVSANTQRRLSGNSRINPTSNHY